MCQHAPIPEPRSPGRRLSRRQALLQAGAGAAAVAASPRRAAAQDATPESATPPAALSGEVTPERAALAVERVGEYVPRLLEQTGLPGLAVAVVHNDEVLITEGFGVRELGTDAPIDADTVFQLASVSKSIAATVVSAVVGDGAISWQSRMADLAPSFTLAEAWPSQSVTLADLFAHRSGLPEHAGDALEDLGFAQAEILHRLRYLTPAYSFRDGYKYGNFDLTAAAEAVATHAAVPWPELSRQRLYEPLGMAHTSSTFADYMAEPNRAIPHVRDGDSWRITPQQRNPDPETAAGGVSSTVNDLTQWLRLVLDAGRHDGQQLIPATALAPVHIPQVVNSVVTDPATQRAGFYGLGSGVSYTDFGTPQWSHSGAFALGAGTAYYMLPASRFGIVVLTNGLPIGVAETLCLDILDVAQRGEPSRDWLSIVMPAFVALMAPVYGTGTAWDSPPGEAAPALPAAAYLGTYRNDFYGEVRVIEAGDGLAFQIGPEPREFTLTHYDRDTFSWQPTGENASSRSGLTFTIGPDNTAVSFDDEYLAWGGPGAFPRSGPATE